MDWVPSNEMAYHVVHDSLPKWMIFLHLPSWWLQRDMQAPHLIRLSNFLFFTFHNCIKQISFVYACAFNLKA